MEERLKRLEERVVQLEEEKAGALVAHLANSGERLAGVRRVALAAVRLGLSSARISAMMPTDYYDRPLEARQGLVGATSRHHLCKSILLEVRPHFFFRRRLLGCGQSGCSCMLL